MDVPGKLDLRRIYLKLLYFMSEKDWAFFKDMLFENDGKD